AQKAAAALEAARETMDRATHADLVAAIRAGMSPGEACPVCGAAVRTLPKTSKGTGLDRARTTAAKAQQTAAGADRAAREAERERDAALSAGGQAVKEIERLDREVAKRRKELIATERDVAKAFGGTLPPDPVATLEERIDRLEALEDEEEDARDAAQEAERAANLAERTRDALLGSVAEHRARLDALPASGIVERARAIAGAGFTAPSIPTLAGAKKDAGAVLELAVGLVDGLEELGERLDAQAAEREKGERRFLEEAEAVVDGLVESPGTLAGLLDAVAEACRTAAAVRATTQKEASGMRERLDNAAKLLEEVAVERGRAATFDALSRELRADRIVAFLQIEALQILAAGGSRHLSTLSGGRYGLAFDEDEFFVIDTWNGDERRRARTLSGGETFLASLGLALALSEHVRSLSVADRARLDSLFLDEGFGTLDPETLEVVVDAIEQLGGDGRIVGVITHVQELAIRLPARIEVEKSPRGSRLQVLR
ncbi:MAG: SbcC/MukB-like Walker B domain-containing protein, partial [Actinomycetota bacterium]